MTNRSNQADRTVTMVRTLPAPRKLVWEAWTQAEHIANWWGPKGMVSTVERLDFREGGEWKISMETPHGPFSTYGEYKEIVEHEKIVCSANFPPMTTNVTLSIVFEDEGEQTRMSFSVIHETVEYKDAQVKMGFEKGWGSTFDRLEELLAAA